MKALVHWNAGAAARNGRPLQQMTEWDKDLDRFGYHFCIAKWIATSGREVALVQKITSSNNHPICVIAEVLE